MNERIKELMIRGWEKAEGPDDGVLSEDGLTIRSTLQVDMELIFQNFAELIVKECMACSTWVGKVNKNAIEPIHTAHAINQRIKKHFGVEE